MIWTDLPRPWALCWQYAEQILEAYNRKAAHALHITANGVEVYPRLLIPKAEDLEAEAKLWPHLAVTQLELLHHAIEQLAEQYPMPREVTVSLLWGGLDGARTKPAYTFRNANEKAA